MSVSRCMFSAWTVWPGVSILWLGKRAGLASNLYGLTVTACKLLYVDQMIEMCFVF